MDGDALAGKPLLFGAVDLGGTKLLSLVTTAGGRVLGRDLRPSLADDGLDAVLARIADSLDSAAAAAGLKRSDLAAVGVASPGAVNFEAGVVSEAPQLPGWRDVRLRELLTAALGLRVLLDNDANAAAVGELTFGAGQGGRHLLYLTVSTGVGGGIIIDGKLYRGKSGAAAELGHIIIQMGGPLCPCGARGCLEAIASGTAIARRGSELLREGRAAMLRQAAGEPERVTAALMAAAAREGDQDCREVFLSAGVALGTALASYVNIFDPDTIVLGGGVMNAGDLIFLPARQTMEALARRLPLRGLRLAPAGLGVDSGALGMVALLRQEFGQTAQG